MRSFPRIRIKIDRVLLVIVAIIGVFAVSARFSGKDRVSQLEVQVIELRTVIDSLGQVDIFLYGGIRGHYQWHENQDKRQFLPRSDD